MKLRPLFSRSKASIKSYCWFRIFSILLFFAFLLFINNASAQTNNWNGSINDNWNTAANWSLNRVPLSTDNVVIPNLNNEPLIVNTAAVCNSFTIQSGDRDQLVTITTGNSLTVTNAVVINAPTGNNRFKRIDVGAGTLTCGSLTMAAGNTINKDVEITVSTGTVNVAGDITIGTGTGTNVGLNDFTFTGAGALNVGGNFSGGNFTAATSTVTYNGTSATQTIGNYTYYNLAFNNTSGTIPQLQLSTNITATNGLTMNSGVLNLNGNTLTLGTTTAASTLTRTASTTTNWMYGGTFTRFWRSAVAVSSSAGNRYGLFPMGASSASSYRPVAINSTANPTSNNSVSVSHVANTGVTDLSPVYNDGGTNIVRKHNAQFTIATAVTGGTYNVAATMTGLFASGSLSDIRLAKSSGATTVTAPGTPVLATGSVSNPTASRSGVTLANLAGDWRITTTNFSNTPLPVTWLSFDALYVANEQMVQLNWATASELNNSGFYIERSLHGKEFEELGYVEGNGTTDEQQAYSFVDLTVEASSYYRLRQVDHDGQFEYSKLIYVSVVDGGPERALYVYPNPTPGEFKIGGNLNEVYDVLVSTVAGEVIVRFEGMNLREAEQRLNDALVNYSKGIYLIRFMNPGLSKTISLIKS